MKRILSGVLALLILLLAITGCSQNNKLLSEEDFNIYSSGKLYLDVGDSLGGAGSCFATFDEDAETFRGLKVNDTVTKLKELYGNEIVYVRVRETNSIEKKSVAECIRTVIDDNYLIRFEKIYIDGKAYDLKEAVEFPIGTKYMCKMLSIRVNGAFVSEIKVEAGRGSVDEKLIKSVNG